MNFNLVTLTIFADVFLLALEFSLFVWSDVTATSQLDCQQRLMEKIYACVTTEGVDFNTLLVTITDDSILESENSTIKSTDVFASQDLQDTEAFRNKVCRYVCILNDCDKHKKFIYMQACFMYTAKDR
ncbi:hypothetical protein ElyMa_001415400 [Elysia marginata]|uniref:Uncharacterized protein n=1 Tax=Elysia marginata TaxID=1093978 RepID=A0AAV4IWL1_9GAST|nr:hypothetical protein ElyMa_001415400 [Elysia marginata]